MNEPAEPTSRRPLWATLLIGCGALLAAAVALSVCGSISIIVALTALGQSLDEMFQEIADEIEEPPPPT